MTFANNTIDPLAYMTAKSHGLEEECQAILEATGITEDQLTTPTLGESLAPPKPVVPTFKSNWPTKASSQSFFEKALLGQVEGLSLEDEPSRGDGAGFEDGAEVDTMAKRNGAFTIEINMDATDASSVVDVALRGKAEEVLPNLALGDLETGRFGDWEIGRLGDWEI